MFGFLKKKEKGINISVNVSPEQVKILLDEKGKLGMNDEVKNLQDEKKFLIDLNNILLDSYWNEEKEQQYSEMLDIRPIIRRLQRYDTHPAVIERIKEITEKTSPTERRASPV